MLNFIEPNDEHIKEIKFYVYKKPLYYGFVGPFIFLYLLFSVTWFMVGYENYLEKGIFIYILIIIINVFTFLSCIWSVQIRSKLLCNEVGYISLAKYAKIVPKFEAYPIEMVKIFKKDEYFYIDFLKVKYQFDEDKKYFKPIFYPVNEPYINYISHKGLIDDDIFKSQSSLYGLNKLNIDIPEFSELMKQRASSPFFVFQVVCVILWSLYDQFYYSLFTLIMLVVFEATLVKQQLKNMSEIRKMGNKPYLINVYRQKRWRYFSSDELLPGDICSITRNCTVPCDILLLKGTCIVDESMLTGESVPQPKESIEHQDPNSVLDLSATEDETSKLRVLYGGTYVVQTMSVQSTNVPQSNHSNNVQKSLSHHQNTLKSPDYGCIGYVLRTGFATSQGKLLRTIVCGVKMRGGTCTVRGSTENFETICFILLLLMFAFASAIYVWIQGSLDPDRNRYKLLLECVLIITSVVPPELPIELSLAINSSLIALSKLNIFCTEPFRIPFAGKLDVCCFDKTGTLTTDNFHIDGVLEYIPTPSPFDTDENDANTNSHRQDHDSFHTRTNIVDCELDTQIILGCCHSLVNITSSPQTHNEHQQTSGYNLQNVVTSNNQLGNSYAKKHSSNYVNVIGDPLEKAILATLGWNITKSDVVIPTCTPNQRLLPTTEKFGNEKLAPIKILHRYHFQSSLKRMSVLTSRADLTTTTTTNGSSQAIIYQVFVKGAPEVLRDMFKNLPANYDEVYIKYAHQGRRILALGSARIDPTKLSLPSHQHSYDTSNASRLKKSDGSDYLNRDNVERDLDFRGFLLVSCPLKPDTAKVVKELLNADHRLVMITGDNHLTACHVARELGIVHPKRQLYGFKQSTADFGNERDLDSDLLPLIELSSESKTSKEALYYDLRNDCFTNQTSTLSTNRTSKKSRSKESDNFSVCLTGFEFEKVLSLIGTTPSSRMRHLLMKTKVFARFTPKQKEQVILAYNKLGMFTLMCGDGTNDVGALKSAHIGVSLLSHGGPTSALTGADTIDKIEKLREGLESRKAALEKRLVNNVLERDEKNSSKSGPIPSKLKKNKFASFNTATSDQQSFQDSAKKKLNKLIEDMDKDAASMEPEVVKLGDASIAAPFTSKHSSIQCVCHIIKQGRCTLVTTLQMYTILALNALILAYSQSVLYLQGVKFSDTQSTIQGLLLAICFLAISRSKPLKRLSAEKPLSNVFNVSTMLTILSQFAVHLFCLLYLYSGAKHLSALDGQEKQSKIDLEAEFKPNLINSTVYVISLTLQVSTFVINYRGRPFMESLYENKALFYSLIVPLVFAISLTLNVSPKLTQTLEIIPFPDQFKYTVLGLLFFDVAASYLVNFVIQFLFGYRK